MQGISFAKSVKEELTSNVYESIEQKKAILSAYIKINGVVVLRNKATLLNLASEDAKIAKFIYELIHELFPESDVHFSFSKKNKGKKTTYSIEIASQVDEIIESLDISFLEGKISKNIVYDDVTISGYLIGAFLSSGSINSPLTSNYHLELALNSENYAKWLSHLFGRYKNSNIEPKIIKRRNKWILYFKRGDQIADFLVMIGAMESVMQFESIRIDRDFANNANRLTNLDTANMSKTVSAGSRQCKEIKYVESHPSSNALLNDKMSLVCSIRLEHESASLDEIADLASEQTGQAITKSNVNHIFRKIHEIYLKEKNNEHK